jgi:hypothetical protein
MSPFPIAFPVFLLSFPLPVSSLLLPHFALNPCLFLLSSTLASSSILLSKINVKCRYILKERYFRYSVRFRVVT